MRGILVFLTALFVLAPYYMLGTMMIEPLIDIVTSVDLAAIGGQSRVTLIKDVYFIWGPMVYVTGWFIWAVRFYVSPLLFVRRGAR